MKSLRRRLLRRVDALAPAVIEASRFVHAHPELGFEEKACSAFLRDRLAGLGFRVERPLKSLPTAFTASYGSARPCVGFVSEYDALPGIGHGCGHNLIAASGFGAAAALAPFARELGGSVRLFGTPAEENGSAKADMVRAGLFGRADAVLLMHPESSWVVNTSGLALDALTFRFRGRSTHASATPHEGRNALDAVIGLFNSVNALRQQLWPDVRVHGIITKGGEFPNIIPDFTEARFYVRARRRERLDLVTRKVKACARGAALAAGCRVSITEYEHPLDDVRNSPVLAELVEKNLRALGVRDILPQDEDPGSTDFGNVSHQVPSLYFYAATAPKGVDLHTAGFARHSGSPRARGPLLLAVKAMALAGLDLLLRPELLQRARSLLKG